MFQINKTFIFMLKAPCHVISHEQYFSWFEIYSPDKFPLPDLFVLIACHTYVYTII